MVQFVSNDGSLKEKERFADICRHLVEVENIKLENIHYRSMSFDPDTVSYSFKQLKSSVVVLSNGVEALSSRKYEEASKCVDCLRRLSGLGLCFVMRDWASFFSYMVEFPMRKPRVPLERMISVRKNWTEISQFVHTGGAKKIKVLGVKITMARVRRILFILHSKQRTRDEKVIGRVGMPEPKIEAWVNPNPGRIFPNRKYSTHVPVSSSGCMLGIQRRPPVNLPNGSLSKFFIKGSLSKLIPLLARGIR